MSFPRLALGLAALLCAAWALAALALTPVSPALRAALAVGGALAVIGLRRRVPRAGAALVVAAAALAVGGVLRAVPAPSHDRAWILPQDRLPTAVLGADEVLVRDVRDFRYVPSGETARAAWDERIYDLRRLSSAWLGVSPFGGIPGVGHVFVSFGFDDGRFLAVSVEARREQGEAYGPLRGLFRAYELIYVVADERDVIALRTGVWGDDVYLYPLRTSPEALRAAFLDILVRANDLARRPEFYDTALNSCSSNLLRHVERVAPGRVVPGLKSLLAAFSDELAHEAGLLAFDGPLEQARARFRVNPRAGGEVDRGDFSARIRAAPPG